MLLALASLAVPAGAAAVALDPGVEAVMAFTPAVTLAAVQDAKPSELFEDFVHYTLIAKPDFAADAARKLLDSGATNGELVEVLEASEIGEKRFEEAMARALLIGELEDVAAELGMRLERGHLELARDSKRIAEAIQMLGGTQRERMMAQRRLAEAGEYAVPALLSIVTGGQDERLRQSSLQMIREIGRLSVAPLCEALLAVDGTNQRLICDVLGDIGYPHAAPYLKDVAGNENASGPAREAATRALARLNVVDDSEDALYAGLSHRYFADESSLIAYPYEAVNNVWRYDAFQGLIGDQVPTAIFNEVMAMRTAARALAANARNMDAVTLYVASNLKRENELPAGESDPIYDENPYTPSFYATVFGTAVNQSVLNLAMGHRDTPLVRDAIASLAQTTGGSNLFSGSMGVRPLLASLSYPDRRVQYEAALTLARALPSESFEGCDRVVPILASAIRSAGELYAMVAADDEENRKAEVSRLQAQGFTVVATAPSVVDLREEIQAASAVDLIVIRMSSVQTARDGETELRASSRTTATPILLVATGVDAVALGRDYRENPRTMVTRNVSDDAYALVVDELLKKAAGGRLTETEAEIYAIESLGALRDVAIARSPIYNVADAEAPLSDALDLRQGGTKLLIADILSLIPTASAQEKLFSAALAADEDDKVDLLDRVAVSVKRHGNFAQPRHIAGLMDLIAASEGSIAEAAARVHGALNLPVDGAVKLVKP